MKNKAIGLTVTYPHKDDPPYRQSLILLLENGYDIGDCSLYY